VYISASDAAVIVGSLIAVVALYALSAWLKRKGKW
jgi:hypothetical protein